VLGDFPIATKTTKGIEDHEETKNQKIFVFFDLVVPSWLRRVYSAAIQ